MARMGYDNNGGPRTASSCFAAAKAKINHARDLATKITSDVISDDEGSANLISRNVLQHLDELEKQVDEAWTAYNNMKNYR